MVKNGAEILDIVPWKYSFLLGTVTAISVTEQPLSNNSSKTALRLDNDSLENGLTLGNGHFWNYWYYACFDLDNGKVVAGQTT